MKRLGYLDQALELLYRLCAAAEAESEQVQQTLPPWYFEQAAIIERKLKDYDGEVAILERYSTSSWAIAGQFDDRLETARAKRARQTRAVEPTNPNDS